MFGIISSIILFAGLTYFKFWSKFRYWQSFLVGVGLILNAFAW